MKLLERCFNGAMNVPKRLHSVPASAEKAEEHLEKANRNILAASVMSENGLFDWAITCSYYAMYHATMASLWLIGIDARSHECAIAAFEAFYVEQNVTGHVECARLAKKLSRKYADSLEYAKTERIRASYGLGKITSGEAGKVLSAARDFVGAAAALVFESKGFWYRKM